MPRMKRIARPEASDFTSKMREFGYNWPRRADQLERDGRLDILGYSLWHRFGEPYREHMRHYRCTVDADGRVVGECSTEDARLLMQTDIVGSDCTSTAS